MLTTVPMSIRTLPYLNPKLQTLLWGQKRKGAARRPKFTKDSDAPLIPIPTASRLLGNGIGDRPLLELVI